MINVHHTMLGGGGGGGGRVTSDHVDGCTENLSLSSAKNFLEPRRIVIGLDVDNRFNKVLECHCVPSSLDLMDMWD